MSLNIENMPDVLAIIQVKNGKIVMDIDDKKIEKDELMVIISQLLTTYLQQKGE